MKAKYCFLILSIFVLIISGCSQNSQKQIENVYPTETVTETLIISLDKTNDATGLNEKYKIYNTGKFVTILTEKNRPETKKEGKLTESDLAYLKSLIQGKEFQTIPPYMEGAEEGCPVIILKVNLGNIDKLLRAESCASTPNDFNKIVTAIEQLK